MIGNLKSGSPKRAHSEIHFDCVGKRKKERLSANQARFSQVLRTRKIFIEISSGCEDNTGEHDLQDFSKIYRTVLLILHNLVNHV